MSAESPLSAPRDPAVESWLALPDPTPAPADPAVVTSIFEGLATQPTARLSQVFLYDDAGSRLYEEITRTSEYYLTSKEDELLIQQAADIAQRPSDQPAAEADTQVVIELGAGEGQKTMRLLEALAPLAARTIYAPIDVSAEALESNAATAAPLQEQGRFETRPFLGRFEEALPRAAALPGSKIFLFLGSSLGNYTDEECVQLLALVAAHMNVATGDRFLIGVDTPHSERKPVKRIHDAYNDSRGVTAAFTVNALRHINALAGLDFDWRAGWRHVAEYRHSERAIVTHIEAVGEQRVTAAASSSSSGSASAASAVSAASVVSASTGGAGPTSTASASTVGVGPASTSTSTASTGRGASTSTSTGGGSISSTGSTAHGPCLGFLPLPLRSRTPRARQCANFVRKRRAQLGRQFLVRENSTAVQHVQLEVLRLRRMLVVLEQHVFDLVLLNILQAVAAR